MARDVDDGTAVLEAVRAGDPDALREVYLRWSPLVHSLALRCLGDVAAAERVTQQVFAGLRASLQADDPPGSGFGRWILGLTCTRIARAGSGEDQFADGESNPGALTERLLLADGLAHLDAVPQRVLRMVLDDVSPADVAERTGMSVDEVRNQAANGLVELSERWEVQADARRR